MSVYLDNLFEKSSEAASTKRNAKAFILSIPGARDATDLSFLRKESSVLGRVNDSANPGARFNRLIQILKVIALDKNHSITQKTLNRYNALMEKYKLEKQKVVNNNVMTGKYHERYLGFLNWKRL